MATGQQVGTGRWVIGPDATCTDIDLDEEVVIYRGERLTEARAERIAAGALIERDRMRRRPQAGGRD